jgi:signal transduction histidine kinase/streptogramin lyase
MCQFKKGRLTPFEFQTDSPGPSPEMIGMYDDQRGNLWAFGDTYLVNLNDGKRFNYFRNGDTASLRIWSLCEGSGGQLWIGTSGQGVFAFADGRFRPLSLRDASIGSDVQAIYEDREGSLWLGTFSGGLVRLQLRRVQALDAAVGLPAEMASCLASGSEGGLWAGYANSGILASVADHFEKQQNGEGSVGVNLVTSMAASPGGALWIATLGLGLIRSENGCSVRITTENGLADDEVLAVAVQKDGTVWAGTSSGTLQRIQTGGIETYHPPGPGAITCILPGASDKVWVGNENGGVFAFVNDGFVAVDALKALAHAPIRALSEDSSGRLWIGTEGRGLACFAAGRLTVWDMAGGFPDNDVNGLVQDEAGSLWMSTRKGIYRMPRFDASQGGAVPALQLATEYERSATFARRGWPQAVKSADGRLWFAAPNSICVVDPRDFHVLNQAAEVSVGPVAVNGRSMAFGNAFEEPRAAGGRPLRFSPALRTLEIEFTTPSLNWPERAQFQHRLDNFDSDWVDGTERRVRYSGLPFGQYQFRVRARGLDGTWGKENTALAFDLPVPVWRAPWAVGAAAMAAALAVAGAVRFISHRRLRLKLAQLGHQQELERERMRIARDMHDEIGSKLTRISYLSELALQDEAPSRHNVYSIAQTVRGLLQTVDEIVWAVDPQNDTLENLASYLGHYASEYLQSTSIECVLNISPDLPMQPVTAESRHNLFLAFEEAVSNALKHSNGTRLRVDMSQQNGTFEIVVQDNGRGFAPQPESVSTNGTTGLLKRKGNGLSNMRQRLSAIGGEARIESEPGRGTTIAFRLPTENSNHDR